MLQTRCSSNILSPRNRRPFREVVSYARCPALYGCPRPFDQLSPERYAGHLHFISYKAFTCTVYLYTARPFSSWCCEKWHVRFRSRNRRWSSVLANRIHTPVLFSSGMQCCLFTRANNIVTLPHNPFTRNMIHFEFLLPVPRNSTSHSMKNFAFNSLLR